MLAAKPGRPTGSQPRARHRPARPRSPARRTGWTAGRTTRSSPRPPCQPPLSSMAAASASDTASGFSQNTACPASRAGTTSAACVAGGVAMYTASTSSAPITSAVKVLKRDAWVLLLKGGNSARREIDCVRDDEFGVVEGSRQQVPAHRAEADDAEANRSCGHVRQSRVPPIFQSIYSFRMKPLSHDFMDDLRRLRVLREFRERGTVTATAEALHLTPSAVSQQLAGLSHDLGFPVTRKDGRRIALTPRGEALLQPRGCGLRAPRARPSRPADLRRDAPRYGPDRRLLHGAGGSVANGPRHLGRRLPRVGRLRPSERTTPALRPTGRGPPRRRDRGRLRRLTNHWRSPLSPRRSGRRRAGRRSTGRSSAAAESAHQPPRPRHGSLDHRLSRRLLCLHHRHRLRRSRVHSRYPPQVDDWLAVTQLVAHGHGVTLLPRLAQQNLPPGLTVRPVATQQHRRHLFAAVQEGAQGSPLLQAVLGHLQVL